MNTSHQDHEAPYNVTSGSRSNLAPALVGGAQHSPDVKEKHNFRKDLERIFQRNDHKKANTKAGAVQSIEAI